MLPLLVQNILVAWLNTALILSPLLELEDFHFAACR